MNKIILAILTIFAVISCNDNKVSKKNEIGKDEWTKITTEKKTIKNITYFFPSEIDFKRRNSAIKECQQSIEENLKLIEETKFDNKFDIEILRSREEMLKYGGMAAQGLALPESDVMFTLLKDGKNSPIKHELMHMITMYKWGNPSISSTWMNEGLATYSAGTCFEYSLEEIYKYFIQSEKLISTEKLATDFYGNPDMIAYTQSAFICKFLIDNYGISKFKKLWKSGYGKFKEIYGFDSKTLENTITEFINKKYPKDINFDWEKFNKGC